MPPSINYAELEKFADSQIGQRIEAVERIGKRIIVRLDNGLRIVIEPRMTGLVLLDDPPSREHLRLEWQLEPQRKKKLHNPIEKNGLKMKHRHRAPR